MSKIRRLEQEQAAPAEAEVLALERALLARARAGDRAALSQLLGGHADALTTHRPPLRLMTLVLPAAGGCAASTQLPESTAPLPDDPARAREELALLEQRIQRDGMARGITAAPETLAYGAEQRRGRAERAAAALAEPSAHAPPPSAEPEDAVEEARAASADRALSSEVECSRPSRLARAICEAAARICQLADFLGEQDARRRCGRARDDCQEARRAVRGRDCSGCS